MTRTIDPVYYPVISVYNKAKTPLGFELAALVAAMQVYLDQYFIRYWGRTATLNVTSGPIKGSWGMVFLDTADEPGALAYHDEENHEPLSKVFVKTTLDAGESVSVSASHELVEMLADSACNRYVTAADGTTLYALEVADPVEETSFQVEGFALSDFVLPAWFEPDPFQLATQFDYCKVVSKPFALATGGYAVVGEGGNWNQIFGSEDKAARFAKEDRRGHRSEYRKRLVVP